MNMVYSVLFITYASVTKMINETQARSLVPRIILSQQLINLRHDDTATALIDRPSVASA